MIFGGLLVMSTTVDGSAILRPASTIKSRPYIKHKQVIVSFLKYNHIRKKENSIPLDNSLKIDAHLSPLQLRTLVQRLRTSFIVGTWKDDTKKLNCMDDIKRGNKC